MIHKSSSRARFVYKMKIQKPARTRYYYDFIAMQYEQKKNKKKNEKADLFFPRNSLHRRVSVVVYSARARARIE